LVHFQRCRRGDLALDGDQAADLAAGEIAADSTIASISSLNCEEKRWKMRVSPSRMSARRSSGWKTTRSQTMRTAATGRRVLDALEAEALSDQRDDEVEGDEKKRDPFEQARAARAAEKAHDPVDDRSDQQPLDGDLPFRIALEA